MTQEEFIEKVAGYVKKYAPQYGIAVHSPIIAQAILESGWGESTLAAKYHNYFGLKCGSSWKGASVNMRTMEEYTVGTLTQIRDNFRVYGSVEEGIKGYFDFIQYPRYKNLRGITDPQKYLETIRADGYATSSSYVNNNMRLVRQYNLTRFDGGVTMGRTAQDYLNVWKGWLGFSEADGRYRQIIDLYNSHKPLARGYAVKYTDEWCDTTVSAAAIKAGMTDLIGTECGCEQHVKIFKAKGIWIENGSIAPKPGYIIVYNWDDSSQPNDGYSDHIGVVEACDGHTITTIEGNSGGMVKRRTIPVGWGYIRGFAAPHYDQAAASAPAPSAPQISVEEAARGVLAGKYGNGDARKSAIEALGLNYAQVQARVNQLVAEKNKPAAPQISVEQAAKEILAGQHGNGDARKSWCQSVGLDYNQVQARVNQLVAAQNKPKAPQISVDQAAREIIAGQHGNGDARKAWCQSVGLDYNQVQAKVNQILAGQNGGGKSIDQVAREVLAGKWGNGDARRQKLAAAGYDVNAVQRRVNQLAR